MSADGGSSNEGATVIKYGPLIFTTTVYTPSGAKGEITGTITGGPEVERWLTANGAEVGHMLGSAVRSAIKGDAG